MAGQVSDFGHHVGLTTVSSRPPKSYLRPQQVLASWIEARGKTEITQARTMKNILRRIWLEEQAEDIAEYAVMMAVILIIVVATVRLIGSNANNLFSGVASSIAS